MPFRLEHAQAELDAWVAHYNGEREHQAIGDVPPIRRFELVPKEPAEVIDPQIEAEDEPAPAGPTVARRVDRAGRISVLKHRYHVGRHLAGQRASWMDTPALASTARLSVTWSHAVAEAQRAYKSILDELEASIHRECSRRPSFPGRKGGDCWGHRDATRRRYPPGDRLSRSPRHLR